MREEPPLHSIESSLPSLGSLDVCCLGKEEEEEEKEEEEEEVASSRRWIKEGRRGS